MFRTSTTASVFQIRPSIAAPQPDAFQIMQPIVTPPPTVAILEPSATTSNACNRLLPTVLTHLDMDLLRPVTPFLFLILFLIQYLLRILSPQQTRFLFQDLLLLPVTLSVSMEDTAEPIQIASEETSAMCRISTIANVLPIRPSIAAPQPDAFQTTEPTVTPPRTVVILGPSATTGNVCNRLLPTVLIHLDMDRLRPATPRRLLLR